MVNKDIQNKLLNTSYYLLTTISRPSSDKTVREVGAETKTFNRHTCTINGLYDGRSVAIGRATATSRI